MGCQKNRRKKKCSAPSVFFLRKENAELQTCQVQLNEVLSERQVLLLGLRSDYISLKLTYIGARNI